MFEKYKNFTLIEFQKAFPDEKSCLTYLYEIKWQDGFICPKCGFNKHYYLKKTKRYQCKSCSHQTTLTAGTIFHKTRTGLHKWFWAIFLMSQHKNGISAMEIMRTLGMSRYETAWLITHKIREAMIKRDNSYNLKDNIELDDIYFGGKSSGKRGRGSENKKVFLIGVEVNGKITGHCKAEIIENTKEFNINRFVKKNITLGSTITTDGYKSYSILTQNYTHKQKNSKKTHESLDKVNLWVSNCKRFLQGTYKNESMKHLDRFISEFNWRFNRRWRPTISFWRLLRACVLTPTIIYTELTG